MRIGIAVGIGWFLPVYLYVVYRLQYVCCLVEWALVLHRDCFLEGHTRVNCLHFYILASQSCYYMRSYIHFFQLRNCILHYTILPLIREWFFIPGRTYAVWALVGRFLLGMLHWWDDFRWYYLGRYRGFDYYKFLLICPLWAIFGHSLQSQNSTPKPLLICFVMYGTHWWQSSLQAFITVDSLMCSELRWERSLTSTKVQERRQQQNCSHSFLLNSWTSQDREQIESILKIDTSLLYQLWVTAFAVIMGGVMNQTRTFSR